MLTHALSAASGLRALALSGPEILKKRKVMLDHEFVTSVLVEQNGKTRLTTTATYESREVRDVVLKSGMERGVAASYNRLDDVLASGGAQANSQGAD